MSMSYMTYKLNGISIRMIPCTTNIKVSPDFAMRAVDEQGVISVPALSPGFPRAIGTGSAPVINAQNAISVMPSAKVATGYKQSTISYRYDRSNILVENNPRTYL